MFLIRSLPWSLSSLTFVLLGWIIGLFSNYCKIKKFLIHWWLIHNSPNIAHRINDCNFLYYITQPLYSSHCFVLFTYITRLIFILSDHNLSKWWKNSRFFPSYFSVFKTVFFFLEFQSHHGQTTRLKLRFGLHLATW